MAKKNKSMDVASMPCKSEKDWDAECAANDLMRAEKHKKDPKLMKRVHKHMGIMKNEKAQDLDDLKRMRNEMFARKKDSDD